MSTSPVRSQVEAVTEETPPEPISRFPMIESNTTIRTIWKEKNREYFCIFCRKPTVNEVELGPLYHLPEHNVTTHYFCLLFSSGLPQQGDDREGILGFLPEDIQKEVNRAKRLKCSYCQVSGASIGCNTTRCKTSFHFPCGLANEASFEFLENFRVHCKNHSEKIPVPAPPSKWQCTICMTLVEPPQKPIVGSCCNGSFFHKNCLQGLALNAGYFFKCPLCNSVDGFPDSAKLQGIFVPEQDAAWEREPNAYEDLYQQYNRCDADPCECPKGAEFGANKGNWLLARCRICGSAGIHRQCGKLATIANWACGLCLEVEIRTEKNPKSQAEPETEIKSELKPTSSSHSMKQGENAVNVASHSNSKSFLSASSSKANKSTKLSKKHDSPGEILNITASKNETHSAKSKNENDLCKGKKARRTGIPADQFDSVMGRNNIGDKVDISELQISDSCKDYFPHTHEQMKAFAKTSDIIPDWRRLTLGVELVDMFLDVVITEPGQAKRILSRPKVKRKSSSKGFATTVVSPIQVASEPVVKKPRKSSPRKKSRRRNNWSKGQVKSKSRKKTSTNQKTKNDKDKIQEAESQSVDTTTSNEKDKSSITEGILVGIQRSQDSLRRLKTVSNVNIPLEDIPYTKSQGEPGSVDSSYAVEGIPDKNQRGKKSLRNTCEEDTSSTGEINGQESLAPVTKNRFTISSNENSSKRVVGNDTNGEPASNSTLHKNTRIRSQLPQTELNNGLSSSPLKKDLKSSKKNVGAFLEVNGKSVSNSSVGTASAMERSGNGINSQALDIVACLRSLDHDEQNEHVKVLERSCPQLFTPSPTKK